MIGKRGKEAKDGKPSPMENTKRSKRRFHFSELIFYVVIQIAFCSDVLGKS